MKKFTKILICVLVLAVMAAGCLTAFAEDPMSVSASDVSAKAGSEVTVTVKLNNNVGMNYLKVQVSYDDSVMTLSSVKNCKLFDALASMPGNTSANPFSMVFAGAADENYSGDLFTLTFTVADDAASGKYNIGIDVAQCANQKNENLSVAADSAVITIEGKTTQPETKETTTETTQPETKETTTETTTIGTIPITGDNAIGSVLAGVCIIAAAAFVATRKKES